MRILIAEDNHILAKILADHLVARGHDVVPVFDGRLASILCRKRVFDAIVIDLVMPDVYGVDVLEELHAEHRMPHAIVITGFPELLDEGGLTAPGSRRRRCGDPQAIHVLRGR